MHLVRRGLAFLVMRTTCWWIVALADRVVANKWDIIRVYTSMYSKSMSRAQFLPIHMDF